MNHLRLTIPDRASRTAAKSRCWGQLYVYDRAELAVGRYRYADRAATLTCVWPANHWPPGRRASRAARPGRGAARDDLAVDLGV